MPDLCLDSPHGSAGRAIPLVSKQEETRDRVLDLVESVLVGQAIPAERQLPLFVKRPG